MENFKEFSGKDFDDAISEACSYFDAQREQLEIDIVQDSKSGIFGLVGARKAIIRARRVQLSNPLNSAYTKQEKKEKQAKSKNETEISNQDKPSKSSEQKRAPKQKNEQTAPKKSHKTNAQRQQNQEQQDQFEPVVPLTHDTNEFTQYEQDCSLDIDNKIIPFEQLDKDKLKEVSFNVISTLVMPIVGMSPIEISFNDAKVCISIDCGEDSGLLIGREGQTLSSLQYIASRVISRQMQTSVRIQLDTGEYRTRQDDKLRDLVLHLAERVRNVGRAHSTRPLSSYHRRIVHMTLQDCTDLVTRSSGEGPLKRVIIQRKRGQ